MKTFLTLALLLCSTVSFASIERIIPIKNAKLVIEAIANSLAANGLTCVDSEHGITSTSQFNWDGLRSTSTLEVSTLESSDDLSQPLITLTVPHLESINEVIKITTNQDMTVVTNVDYSKVYISIKTVRKNVGTILNPEFEETISVTEEVRRTIQCK